MRKIAGILFFVLFVFLQYGKLLSFLYCTVRVSISSSNSISCDCDRSLAPDASNSPFGHPAHANSLKEKLDQPYTSAVNSMKEGSLPFETNFFWHKNKELSPGFTHPPLHPPSC